jgi:UDP-N-acetylglucosamine 4,6-dehydratase
MRLLITGATGALGQALIRRLVSEPTLTRLVCYSRSESRQADVQRALPDHPALRWVLGDVRDRERLIQAMGGCEAVIHAAALKRVDAMAYNPGELRKTNIEGSAHVIEAALAAGVGRVLMISSDKAVEPINAYGKSKAAMEEEAIASNSFAVPRGTRIAVTRWGNVLASTGSIVPLWRAALASGQRLRLTDPNMTRFWLTLEQAAAFALWALGMLRGGEIFLPMLSAMRLGDLAEALAPGSPTEIIGLRPGGEKRHEVLMTREEGTRAVAIGASGDPGIIREAPDGQGAWVINPSIHSWRADAPWDGEPWPAEAVYRSDLVPRLSVEEMRAWLKG